MDGFVRFGVAVLEGVSSSLRNGSNRLLVVSALPPPLVGELKVVIVVLVSGTVNRSFLSGQPLILLGNDRIRIKTKSKSGRGIVTAFLVPKKQRSPNQSMQCDKHATPTNGQSKQRMIKNDT